MLTSDSSQTIGARFYHVSRACLENHRLTFQILSSSGDYWFIGQHLSCVSSYVYLYSFPISLSTLQGVARTYTFWLKPRTENDSRDAPKARAHPDARAQ